jgi:hypothetical protein
MLPIPFDLGVKHEFPIPFLSKSSCDGSTVTAGLGEFVMGLVVHENLGRAFHGGKRVCSRSEVIQRKKTISPGRIEGDSHAKA